MIRSDNIYIPRLGEHIVYHTCSRGEHVGICIGYKVCPGFEDNNVRLFIDISSTDNPLKRLNSRIFDGVRAATPDEITTHYMKKCIPDIKQRDAIIKSLIQAGFKR